MPFVTRGGSSLGTSVDGSELVMGSDAQGDILIRNATQYARLAAGTSGQILQTKGTGANPQWAAPGLELIAKGTLTSTSTSADNALTKNFSANELNDDDILIIFIFASSTENEPRVEIKADNSTVNLSTGQLPTTSKYCCQIMLTNTQIESGVTGKIAGMGYELDDDTLSATPIWEKGATWTTGLSGAFTLTIDGGIITSGTATLDFAVYVIRSGA